MHVEKTKWVFKGVKILSLGKEKASLSLDSFKFYKRTTVFRGVL